MYRSCWPCVWSCRLGLLGVRSTCALEQWYAGHAGLDSSNRRPLTQLSSLPRLLALRYHCQSKRGRCSPRMTVMVQSTFHEKLRRLCQASTPCSPMAINSTTNLCPTDINLDRDGPTEVVLERHGACAYMCTKLWRGCSKLAGARPGKSDRGRTGGPDKIALESQSDRYHHCLRSSPRARSRMPKARASPTLP